LGKQLSQWHVAITMIVLSIIMLFSVYFPTVQSTVLVWSSSETFAHGFLIFPISLWLGMRLRAEIGHLPPKTSIVFLPLLFMDSLLWLVAYVADVQVVQQLALVTIIPLLVLILLGWQITKKLVFPLFFLIFAVPMGDILIPPLINFTADFTVSMVQLVGIPIYREGTFFQLPTGNWSVVTACSGVRYLIASVTLGFLYAYLTYKSFWKRCVFILVSIVVPILANGLRAFMIVMIGHFSGMELATGIDHLIYGWLFFGVVIAVMFYIGSFWRDNEDEHVEISELLNQKKSEEPFIPNKKIIYYGILTMVVFSLAPIFAYTSERSILYSQINIEPPVSSEWQMQDLPVSDWEPDFIGIDKKLHVGYRRGEKVADLFIGFYAWQREGAQLITSSNVLVQEEDERWLSFQVGNMVTDFGGKSVVIPLTKISSSNQTLLVASFYFIQGAVETNPYNAKLLAAKAKLMRNEIGSSIVTIAVHIDDDEALARNNLKTFILDMNSPLLDTLTNIQVN